VAEKGGDLPGFADLELIRTEAAIAVTRFCILLGIPRATWYRWKSAVDRRPGRWPAPVVDPLEPLAATYAATFAAWGHRKLWALLQADGHHVSMSSVARALGRRGLLLPQRYQAERRQLARARRAVFIDPPTRRCRVWQFDFSEFETTSGGIWRLGGVVDYVAKVSLACPTTTTQTAVDAIAAIEAARVQAETWLGYSLLEECLDLVTGELVPLAIVTDNGAAFRSAAFARYIASRPEFTHVRTRNRSPGTNGVIERFFQALKYEYLYREELEDGPMVAAAVERYRTLYDTIRPHEAIGFRTPLAVWRDFDRPPVANLFTPLTVSLS
jgi:transposase InsO family protein